MGLVHPKGTSKNKHWIVLLLTPAAHEGHRCVRLLDRRCNRLVFQYSCGAALATIVLLEHTVRVLYVEQKLLIAHHIAGLLCYLEVK